MRIWYQSSDPTGFKKANKSKMLNYSFNYLLFLLVVISLSLCVSRFVQCDWPSRNKCCEARLGEGVAVFYEPLKFYSSLHRHSLQPRGHCALNKLPSFLYPFLPNICSSTSPHPQNPSTHRLNGLFIVWCSSPTSSFFPLSLFLFPVFLLSTRVQWCRGLSDVVHLHVCCMCWFSLRVSTSPCLC